jgi:hypothetical protein
MNADNEMPGPSLSLVAGGVAWTVLILAGTPLVASMLLVDRGLYAWASYTVCLCSLCLGYGGVVSAWSERQTKPRRLAFPLSVTALAAAVPMALLPVGFAVQAVPLLLTLLIVASPALLGPVAAPFVAFGVRRSRARVWPLVVLWLAPAIGLAPFGLWAISEGWIPAESTTRYAWILPLVLTGPWATQTGRLIHFPNAGEVFMPVLALVLTAAMAALVGLYVKRPQWRAPLIIPCATLAALWALIGYAQLLICVDGFFW